MSGRKKRQSTSSTTTTATTTTTPMQLDDDQQQHSSPSKTIDFTTQNPELEQLSKNMEVILGQVKELQSNAIKLNQINSQLHFLSTEFENAQTKMKLASIGNHNK